MGTHTMESNELKDHFVEWIQHILDRKDWTPTDLARNAGLSPSTILRPLNKPEWNHTLTFDTIKKISNGSGYPVPRKILEAYDIPVEAGADPEPKPRDLTVPKRPRLANAKAVMDMSNGGNPVAGKTKMVRVRNVSSLPASLQPPPTDEVQVDCPSQLERDDTAFAFYMPDSAFEPILRSGTLMYATQRRNPNVGDLVFITKSDGRSMVRMVTDMGEDKISLSRSASMNTDETINYSEIREIAIVAVIVRL